MTQVLSCENGAKGWQNKWKSLIVITLFSVTVLLNLAIVLIMFTDVQIQKRQTSRTKSKSSSWSSSNHGKGKSTPSLITQDVSSTHASSSKKCKADSHFDGDIDSPLTRKDILVIAKAVTMPGKSIHQSPDDLDTVEQPDELDNLVL